MTKGKNIRYEKVVERDTDMLPLLFLSLSTLVSLISINYIFSEWSFWDGYFIGFCSMLVLFSLGVYFALRKVYWRKIK